jgi:NhaP-type Na+/H+ or K+/H+ antiporter
MPASETAAAQTDAVEVLLVVGVILIGALFARAMSRAWISTALYLVVAGLLFGPSALGWFDVGMTSSTFHLLASLALATVLFSDAAKTELRGLRSVKWQPLRLLTIGLVGSIVLGMLLAMPLLPALTAPLALVLATTLAPTDGALGTPVFTNPAVPADVREVLTVESGLNDGLAVPVLLLALGWAGLGDTTEAGFVRLLVEVLGIGAAVGAGLAGLVALAWITTVRRWGSSPGWSPLVPLLTAIACYGLAEHLGGSGFIAAFVGGLVSGAICRGRTSEDLAVDESVSNLLQGATWFTFGAMALGPVLLAGAFDWHWLAYAVLSLTIVRLVPVTLALLGTGERWPTVAFMGWFGPRGLASVVFLVIVLDTTPPPDAATAIFGTVAITVFLSILLHGLSARPAARAFAAWTERTS